MFSQHKSFTVDENENFVACHKNVRNQEETILKIPESANKDLVNDASTLITNLNDMISTELSFWSYPTTDNFSVAHPASHLTQEATNTPRYGLFPDVLAGTSFPILCKSSYLVSLNESFTKENLKDTLAYYQWDQNCVNVPYLISFISRVQPILLPFTSSLFDNLFIQTILKAAKASSFLMYAVLAMSARYESYRSVLEYKEKKQKGFPAHELEPILHDIRNHYSCRATYLSSCTKELDKVLLDRDKIPLNVEMLLVTMLLLASDFSSSKGSKWRDHIKGVKSLLMLYGEYQPQSQHSPALIISRTWFYSFEVLANLTSPKGGTIHDYYELDKFLDFKSSKNPGLNTIGYLVFSIHHPNVAYNLYLGYNDDVMDALREISETILALRTFQASESTINHNSSLHSFINLKLNTLGSLNSSQLFVIIKHLADARSFYIVTKTKPYQILPESPYYPESPELYLPSSAYLKNGEMYYSWFDISQQLYSAAAYLKTLTNESMLGLAIDHAMVQEVVAEMITTFGPVICIKNEDDYLEHFYKQNYRAGELGVDFVGTLGSIYDTSSSQKECEIESQKLITTLNPTQPNSIRFDDYVNMNVDTRVVMVQWPLFICGLCSVKAEHRVIIDCYFNTLMKLGAGSGELSLEKIKRIWGLYNQGKIKKLSQGQDDDDNVPFT